MSGQDDISTMIEDCQNRESKLSDWEAQFIDNIDSQIHDDGSLSEKQQEKLEQIWEKIT